jgi:hypothetical protein
MFQRQENLVAPFPQSRSLPVPVPDN